MNDILNNSYFQNIVSGVVGAALFYFFQRGFDKSDKRKEKLESSIVGRKALKILAQDFLYQYEPHNITVEKIVEEFGGPTKQIKMINEITTYLFEFQNAKVAISEENSTKNIVCITVFSKLDNKHPVNCRLSFEEDDKILGQANISDVIIKDHFYFKNFFTQLGFETIIGCSNSYRQTKHLKYYYQIEGKFDSIVEAKGQIIKQACVTQAMNIYYFFSFHDTFYN